MPDPESAAAKLAKAMEKLLKLESGSFADIRKMND